eukprot:gene7757-9222_t
MDLQPTRDRIEEDRGNLLQLPTTKAVWRGAAETDPAPEVFGLTYIPDDMEKPNSLEALLNKERTAEAKVQAQERARFADEEEDGNEDVQYISTEGEQDYYEDEEEDLPEEGAGPSAPSRPAIPPLPMGAVAARAGGLSPAMAFPEDPDDSPRSDPGWGGQAPLEPEDAPMNMTDFTKDTPLEFLVSKLGAGPAGSRAIAARALRKRITGREDEASLAARAGAIRHLSALASAAGSVLSAAKSGPHSKASTRLLLGPPGPRLLNAAAAAVAAADALQAMSETGGVPMQVVFRDLVGIS